MSHFMLDWMGAPPPSATPPTFVSWNEVSNWSYEFGGSQDTNQFAIQTGDVLVAVAILENGQDGMNAPINDGAALTWTERVRLGAANGNVDGYIWTATADSSRNLIVTFKRHDNATEGRHWGAGVYVIRGSAGIGAVSSPASGTASATNVALTTQHANSMIILVNGLYNQVGAAGTFASTGAGAYTSNKHHQGTHTAYVGRYNNAGAAGAKTLTMSSPTGTWRAAAIEVRGQ